MIIPRRPTRSTAPLAWVLLLPLALSGCAGAMHLLDASRPSARVSGAHLGELSTSGLRLTVDVDVTNNMPVAVPLLGLDWALATEGEPFLSGAIEPGGGVPAGGTRTVPVPMEVLFTRLLSTVTTLRPGAVASYAVDLGLSLELPGGERVRLPLRQEGSLPIPAVPSIGVETIRLEELSLQSARGVVRLAIGNTNLFPMEIEALTYGLRLGNTSIADGSTGIPGSLDAGETRPLEIPLDVSPIAAGAALLQTLSSGRTGYTIEGVLRVTTPFGDMNIPFGSSGETNVER